MPILLSKKSPISVALLLAAFIAAFVFADDDHKSETQKQKHDRIISEVVDTKKIVNNYEINLPESKPYQLAPSDKQLLNDSKNAVTVLQKRDFDLVDNTVQVVKDFQQDKPTNLNSLKSAREFAQELQSQQGIDQSNFTKHRYTTLIFASLSLSDVQLEQLMALTSGKDNTVVVFRGLRDPKKMMESIQEIQEHTKKHDPLANVVLDPTMFRDYRVTQVPTIIQLDADGKTELGRATGITSTQYLQDKIRAGSSGDFGVMGEVSEIIEQDMILAMQDKMQTIDWQEKKDLAAKRFWTKQQFIVLPAAGISKRKIIDPTVVSTSDITSPDGSVLVPKGTQINPLRVRQFNMALIVFDPSDKRQLEQTKILKSQMEKKYGQVKLIATQIDRAGGWDGYNKISDQLDSHIVTLTQDVKSRFELTSVPSVVTAENNMFIVQEIGLNWPNEK